MSIIRLEPPPRVRTEAYEPGDLPQTLSLLQDFPRRWAVIGEYELARATAARMAAYQINVGRRPSLRPAVGAFEAATRTVDGEVRLYAQYVPEGGSSNGR